jgi:hypothetical protein
VSQLRFHGGVFGKVACPRAAITRWLLLGAAFTVEQIGEYKNRVHETFLAEWKTATNGLDGFSVDDVWRIREECIAALGAGEYRTRTSDG